MNKNPDFTKISLDTPNSAQSIEQWRKDIEKKTGKKFDDRIADTMEQIPVKPL